jgi:cell volume regulation protein A
VKAVESFGWLSLAISLAVLAAVFSNRFSDRFRIPAPGLFLLGAAVISDLFPALGRLPIGTVQDVVTVALGLILFDGGMHIGWRRFRHAAGAIVWVGVAGTLVTALALAGLAHALFGFGWQAALLLGTALAPTDPAVVFSVLGRREVVGRSGLILEGESGANDPVGIALIVVLVSTSGAAGLGRVVTGLGEFALQMGVGAAVGVLGGLALRWLVIRVPLPNEGLYPLRTLAFAGLLYGAATVAHGSGFLAVFVAGILLGDVSGPYQQDTRRFHAALASLAEIVAFVVLGLTVSVRELRLDDVLVPGLVIGVVLALVIRPVLVGLVLWPVRLRRGERLFVLWSGLKGAVPVLLGTFVLLEGVPSAGRVYGIIFVVVTFSVFVQGSLVPAVARRCRVPMQPVTQRPWELAMRFEQEPSDLLRFQVTGGSPADGATVRALGEGEHIWVNVVNRGGAAVAVRGDTVLAAGDEVLAVVDADDPEAPARVFSGTAKI